MAYSDIVDLYQKIMKSKGYSGYEMARKLGITQTQFKHYLKKPISTREVLLVRLQEMSGLSEADFWGLLKREAKTEDDKRTRRAIEQLKKP